ncbi:transcriptional regulator [Sporolactobacillus shoreae]|uniref:Transcriptional regulator n=1 Tax=Sporolactobacillus shoreae TaxID=1465501 RepID=A0A4Z0GNK5_9BACL|nr:Rrf2 family transcriptional regulator [Sporolactobacillus shoreae]TGA97776.1 transcriptional regulator [Sporolactobacillus shoreae]
MNSEFTIAVHCLIILASAPDQIWNSESLSGKVHTHPARVRKIMSLLRNNDLVATKEGLGGGYRLSCDPADCTLARIYRITSCSALKLNWCSDSKKCGQDQDMVGIQLVLDQAFSIGERMLENYLEQWTIDLLFKEMNKVMKNKKSSFLSEAYPAAAGSDRLINSYRIGGERG